MIVLYCILGVLFILIAVMALNTWVKKPAKKQDFVPPKSDIDEAKASQHLSGMIKHKTVTSGTMEGFDEKAFLGLHKYLEKTYPLVHKTLEKQVVNKYSLIYKWKGSGSEKKPILLMAHQDVVPVEQSTLSEWEHEPFSGEVADGYVWGRGALDMKGQLCQIFEGIESLLEKGYEPQRDVYIALGHDEESMGIFGAGECVKTFKEMGISFDFVLDEGGVLMDGKIMGIDANVAAIGICEKGYADIRLTVDAKGGHASRPPKETAVGTLARAITALEKHQMHSGMNTALKGMLDAVGGYMKFPLNVIASNLWITKPLLIKGLAAGSTGAAMVRTTMAPTMLSGSGASNVLAARATAVVNCRIAPGDSVADVAAHFKKVINNDDVKVEVIMGYEPSKVSSIDSEGYEAVYKTAAEMFGDFVLTPYLMVAATDSRRYGEIADNVYLFQPTRSVMEDLATIHAAGERISTQSLAEGAEFFARLVKNADG